MCYRKPGPRCSNHTFKELMKAIDRFQGAPNKNNATLIAIAREEWYRTPDGIKELREQGLTGKADKYEKARAQALNTVKRLYGTGRVTAKKAKMLFEEQLESILSEAPLDEHRKKEIVHTLLEESMSARRLTRDISLAKESTDLGLDEIRAMATSDVYVLARLEARIRQAIVIDNCVGVRLDPPGYSAEDYKLDGFGRPAEVWYSSYGSNLFRERLLLYIEGGSMEGISRVYKGSRDKMPPIDDIPVKYDHSVFFAGASKSWDNGGVGFLDPSPGGQGLGRAYRITSDQFDDIITQENGGDVDVLKPKVWAFDKAIGGQAALESSAYGNLVHVGDYQGAPVMLFTTSNTSEDVMSGTAKVRKTVPFKSNSPSLDYVDTIGRGIQETFGLDRFEVADYIRGMNGAELINSWDVLNPARPTGVKKDPNPTVSSDTKPSQNAHQPITRSTLFTSSAARPRSNATNSTHAPLTGGPSYAPIFTGLDSIYDDKTVEEFESQIANSYLNRGD